MIDWSDGSYERTAATLDSASERVAERAGIRAGIRVLDLGAGTGNAALAAARRGGSVVAVEPADRLLEIARARATAEKLALTCLRGDASAIPAGDGAFDVVLSVFAVIFAPDAEQAASEMVRVVRPGGHIVMTSWTSEGGIAEAGRLVREAMAELNPGAPTPSRGAPAWGDPAFVHRLFEERGARVTIEESSLPFTAASPEAWFDEQKERHPVWRFVHRALADRPDTLKDLRARSVERLQAWNESADAFRVTSKYLVIDAERV